MRTASVVAVLAAISVSASSSAPAPRGSASQYLIYFGTYTGPVSKGIYVARFDTASGKVDEPRLAAEITRPSWVTIHPNQRFLYAISETGYGGGGEGTITSFSIDPASGTLTKLNDVSTGGGGPCHLAIDRAAKTIFVANYGSGSTAAFRLGPDGRIGERTAFVQHKGSSVNPKRQRGPHAHAVVLAADNKFLFVPDLGTDEIMSYRVGSDGSLSPNEPSSVKVKPGSGPRHFVLHPGGKFAYGLNEMGSSVTAFTYDPGKGQLHEVETVSTLPAGFTGEDNSAEIQVDRAGKFLYASNRGHDSITVFTIDRGRGTLTNMQNVPTQGKTPRNFAIDPTGKYLLAANQDGNNVVVFQVDPKTGKLTPTGQVLSVASPVCIQFLPVARE